MAQQARRQAQGTELLDLAAAQRETNPQQLANNALTTWGYVQLLQQTTRPSGDQGTLYDQLIQRYGNGDRGAALTAANGALVAMIQGLNTRVQIRSDVGDDLARRLDDMLTAIQAGSQNLDTMERFQPYRAISAPISNLLDSVRRTTPRDEAAQPVQGAPPTVSVGASAQAQVLEQPIHNFGQIHYITDHAGAQYYAVGGTVSPSQQRLFGSSGDAQAFVGALGVALADRLNNAPQNAGSAELLAAMNTVTSAAFRSNPHFMAAMDLLRAGQRDRALDELSQVGALYNSLRDTANHQVLVSIDQRMVTVFTGRATVVLDIAGSQEDFTRWLRSEDNRSFGRAVVQLALEAAYSYLRGSGTVVDTTGGVADAGSARRVPVSGHALSLTPQLALSTSVGTTPIRIIAHCNFGARTYGTDDPISVLSPGGQSQDTSIRRDWAPYLGVWGLEVQFPVRAGAEGTIRFERAGAGVIGTDFRNHIAYFSVSGSWARSDTLRVSTVVTPMYSSFFNILGQYQPRPGIEVDIARIQAQINQQLLQVSPLVARVEYNTATQVWTFTGGPTAVWRPHPAWQISASLGYIVEAGGDQMARLRGDVGPGYLYGGLGLTWTPGAGSRREAGSRLPSDTRPVRIERETSAQRQLREASQFLQDHPDQANSARAQSMARDLAGVLDGYFRITAPNSAITGNAEYTRAIQQLQAGNLREGLNALANVPGMQ